jgi:hypothetical protein
MLKNLIDPQTNYFNKLTLIELEPYFDLNFTVATEDEKIQWFNNLLTLAQYNLGVAHCVHHNATARYVIQLKFTDKTLPKFVKKKFSESIGGYSGAKSSDTLKIDGNKLNGQKNWISNLHQADYCISRIKSDSTETFVLVDMSELKHSIIFVNDQLGMEVATPGSFNAIDYVIPDEYILGHRSLSDNNSTLAGVSNFHDYCFITNHLGCIIGLYNLITETSAKNKFDISYELTKFRLEIAALKFMWSENIESINESKFDDSFWHKRNTQYNQSKNILVKLIALGLEIADSSWTNASGPGNQRFRDALVFAAHMQSLAKGLRDQHFIAF